MRPDLTMAMPARSGNLLLACVAAPSQAWGPTVEDQVAQVAEGRAGDDTRPALPLARERAVEPLLGAADDGNDEPGLPAGDRAG